MRGERRGAGGAVLLLALLLLAAALPPPRAAAAPPPPRFPQPEFRSGYEYPRPSHAPPVRERGALADAAVLAGALGLSSWLSLKGRSRRGLVLLSVFSVLYFGFHRLGCVCSVGSIQNALLAAVEPGRPFPLPVAAAFLLPLLFALFLGRSFCGAVCPLGALQDLAALRPVAVPPSLDRLLRAGPRLYLAAAATAAAGGAAFLVCRYDPYVSFFRLSGHATVLLLGAALLLLGAFAARPYCRWLCPYGLLLGWASSLSRRVPAVTPGPCVHCRLCEGACPFGAIVVPLPPGTPPAAGDRRGLAAALLLAVPLVLLGGWLGGRAEPLVSRLHPEARLLAALAAEESGKAKEGTEETAAFRRSDRSPADLQESVGLSRRRTVRAGQAAGAFLGLSFCGALASLSLPRRGGDHAPSRSRCVSCGRCFDACPVEHLRRQGGDGEVARLEALLARDGGVEAVRAGMAGGNLLEAVRRGADGRG